MMRGVKKQGFLRRYGRLLIGAYLLCQALMFYVYYTNNQVIRSNEESSAIISLLSEFKDRPSQDHRTTSVDSNTFTSNAKIERNTTVSLGYYNNPLERDFSRVPAYIEGSRSPPLFGYVMRDLANRFLVPSSPQQKRWQLMQGQFTPSNILVACPRASELLTEIRKKDMPTIDSKKELIKSLGYRIGPAFLVETIFNGQHAIPIDSDTAILGDTPSKSTDVLLAILDPAPGQEKNVISSELAKLIDSGSIQYATFPISSSLSMEYLFSDISKTSGIIEMQGLEVAETFLAAGYKLQILSSSHVPTDRLNPFGPNTLLKNIEDVRGFLKFGAGSAKKAEFTHLSKALLKNLTLSSKNTKKPMTFHSILFATRSLDLAIPSRKAFLDLDGKKNDFTLNVEKDGVPIPNCPAPSSLRIFSNDDKLFEIDCFGTSFTMDERHKTAEDGKSKFSAELWYSHQNHTLSEAFCLKCTKSSINDNEQSVTESVCSSRFPYSRVAKSPPNLSDHERTGKQSRNLVAIELRGINQNMLQTSLARFKAALATFDLEYFSNFVRSSSNPVKEEDQEWWRSLDKDLVEGSTYQRFRGSNQCDLSSPSDDNQSAQYRGIQMSRMFCFDYDRPNCLGREHTAVHLLHYVRRFVIQSSRQNARSVSYVTLIDGTEESETLAGGLDLPLRNFLNKLEARLRTSDEWSRTVIVIFSNDVEEPILFLKASEDEKQLLKEQKTLFTSDLRTILRSIMNNELSESLFHTDLASENVTRKAYPVSAEATDDEHTHNKTDVITPPSVLSFYADIPKEHKFQLVNPSSKQATKRAKVSPGCSCATNKRPWAPCDVHPWDTGDSLKRAKENFILVDCPDQPLHLEIDIIPNKSLLKRSFRNRSLSKLTNVEKVNIVFLEIDSASQQYADRHFPKTRELLKKYQIKENGEAYDCLDGLCSAEFPYASLVGANSIPNQVAALSGCISSTADDLCGFEVHNNQLCNDTTSMHYGFRFQAAQRSMNVSYWCPDRDLEVTKTPWLFGVSDSKGYINYFGEEFCYDHSPYVTQGNVFPKFYQDIESHDVFCGLVDRKGYKDSKVEVHKKHKWGVEMSDPCIEGDACLPNSEKSMIAFQFIEQMWDTYAHQPKFAFLNAIAAHDYSFEWDESIRKAEAYDEHVHNFLQRMISRKDSDRTVIIIRSDHGLQKGPTAIDYSVQFEHRRPWLEVVMPQGLLVSEKAFFNNQGRMLTGYDLYKTMRYLMSDRTNAESIGQGIPDWSFDIIAEEIDRSRTCKDAKADLSLCRSKAQTRQYGVCNLLDSNQTRFC